MTKEPDATPEDLGVERPIAPPPHPVTRIQGIVAVFYSIDATKLRSVRYAREVPRETEAAMYLCRKHTSCSLHDLAQRFGRKDHTGVLHACRRVETKLLHDTGFRKQIERIEALLV